MQRGNTNIENPMSKLFQRSVLSVFKTIWVIPILLFSCHWYSYLGAPLLTASAPERHSLTRSQWHHTISPSPGATAASTIPTNFTFLMAHTDSTALEEVIQWSERLDLNLTPLKEPALQLPEEDLQARSGLIFHLALTASMVLGEVIPWSEKLNLTRLKDQVCQDQEETQ